MLNQLVAQSEALRQEGAELAQEIRLQNSIMAQAAEEEGEVGKVIEVDENDTEEAARVIMEDVFDTGYFFLLCQDIQAVWETCTPLSHENEELGEEDQVMDFSDCEGESPSSCHMRAEEILCRN